MCLGPEQMLLEQFNFCSDKKGIYIVFVVLKTGILSVLLIGRILIIRLNKKLFTIYFFLTQMFYNSNIH